MGGRIVRLILIVGPDPRRRAERHRRVRAAGHQALSAATAVHALALAGKVRPSVVLTEMDLGDEGRALALVRALRAREALRGVPVVLIGVLTAEEHAVVADDGRLRVHTGAEEALIALVDEVLAA